uniref:Ig-like domain-containing protein n=1 Tax=Acinetobacter bereziniae TaxID=106648 RepID=UPI0030170103
MKNITIYEKGTAKILTQDLVNKHHAVYKVNLDSAEIAKIVKVNNNLEVYLQSGEKVVIEDFFIGEKPKEFTIETSDGKHYLLEFLEFDANGTVTKIDYLGINDFHEYLVGEHAAVPVWAWVAGAAGIIGIAAAAGSSGGSSNHSENGDKTAPKITHQILDNQKIKITADEASKITIVDSAGKTIGSGQLNQAGSLDITLTRPLVDNEKITITAIDNAGNKTTETINVGDVTKPEFEVNIVDNNSVHIVSNEPGSKVIIKNEAGQTIGEGVIGSNGQLNVDLNTTLTDGSKIIVDVIDTSGNQTEKVITVGDVTPPIIESNIKDATHIEVTSNEPGQVKITDSNGNVIGTGTITGNNVFDDIQLTRPLTDGEKVTVTVTDGGGNPKTIEITAGDVTAPIITSTVQDATHIEVTSNEPGQVKITDSNGNVIGTGTITGNNVVDDIQLTRPLADSEKVIVTVTDGGGNPKTIEITAGDVTAPIITSTVQDATHIEVTSNEAGQVKITDGNGNVIGTGTITGNNVVDDIQLTRPLVDGETVTVTVTDAAGNPKALDITAGDVTAPTITSTVQDATHIEVTSNEAGQVKITDSNGNVIGTGTITGNNVVDDIQLTRPLADGETVTVTVTDAAGNPKAIDITAGDVTAPTITSTVQDATHIEVTSNEAGQVKITDSNGNVIGTGTITGNNVVDDIQLTRPLADGETVTVTVTDTAGNPKALDITAGDVTAPTITSTVQDATHIEVTSNEAGQVKITDSNGNVIGTGTITGNNVVDDIQLTRPLADGEKVTVTVTDVAGNPKAIDITAGDVTNPQFESANVDNSGTQLTLTYSEALDSTNLPTPDSFVVTAGGQSVTITGVSINGNNVILTLAPPITTGQSVQIAYTDPTTGNDTNAIQDVAGNDAASLPATTVTNDSTVPGTDTTPPIFVSATVDNTGTQLVLTYNKDLDSANLPLINSFAVTADGQIVAVTGVSVNGSTVVLTLGTAVTAGQSVEVGYTDPSADNDVNAIQDIAGNDAATLTPTAVDNGSTV